MNLDIPLTLEQLRSLDGSVLDLMGSDGKRFVVRMRDEHSSSGIIHKEVNGVHYVCFNPSRGELVRDRGETTGLSDTGHHVRLYDPERNSRSPNLF